MAPRAKFCPGGHELPHKVGNGNCTVLFCLEKDAVPDLNPRTFVPLKGTKKIADAKVSLKEKAVALQQDTHVGQTSQELREVFPATDAASKAAREGGKVEELEQLQVLAAQAGRYAARKRLFPVPAFTDEKQAAGFVEKRLMELAPEAVAQLEYDLKMGDGKARTDAAKDILDRAGFSKSDREGKAQAPVIIINPEAVMAQLPWARRKAVEASNVVVEAAKAEEPS
jgi:hypothetical protein